MKVKAWTDLSTPLVYQGSFVTGLVLLEGEKRAKIQSISPNQQVQIDPDHYHSSLLLAPEESENLLVYVKPIAKQTTWQGGVPEEIWMPKQHSEALPQV